MVRGNDVGPDEFGEMAKGIPFTREFRVTKLVESRPSPEERRCLAECGFGHRFVMSYD